MKCMEVVITYVKYIDFALTCYTLGSKGDERIFLKIKFEYHR